MSNVSSPSVLEEKCSKNEHDAVPVGLPGKGLHNPRTGELASSDASDIPEASEPSEEISVVVSQSSISVSG
jgi:hypothetical protein